MLYNKRLKELRGNKTQEEISNYLKIERNTYSTYETEEVILPITHLINLCDYFNVSVDYLLEFTNDLIYQNEKSNYDIIIAKKRLKEFRENNKISQRRLAIILRCSASTIAGYESGRYIIATPFLYTICKKYNISADYLLGKIDTPKYLNSPKK